MKIARYFISLPFALLLVVFALSNTERVSLGLWPLEQTSYPLPLFIWILALCAFSFFAGALLSWLHFRPVRKEVKKIQKLLNAKNVELSQLKEQGFQSTEFDSEIDSN